MNPLPHTEVLPHASPARVLGCGAYLKNRACLIDGDAVHWSAVHGDLGDPAARDALKRSISELLVLASGPVDAVAHDLHPDFYSTHLARELSHTLRVPAVAVQHHHAHIGVALAEHAIGTAVLGIALDGVGLGSDDTAWGGELIWVAHSQGAQRWQRLEHLAPLPMPGGDVAAREPWRLAAAVLHCVHQGHLIEKFFAPVVGVDKAKTVHHMLTRHLNCPGSTGAGRWFDAAAGALGISAVQTHEAEAAMAMEQRAAQWLAQNPGFNYPWDSLDLYPVVQGLFAHAEQGDDARGQGAARFHMAMVNGLAHRTLALAADRSVKHAVLAGGCFANAILRQELKAKLEQGGLAVYETLTAGCGDAGLALGQAWIAACTVKPHPGDGLQDALTSGALGRATAMACDV